MKWNDEIRELRDLGYISPVFSSERIYDPEKSNVLYASKKATLARAKKFSLMKQENVRMAFESDDFSNDEIYSVLQKVCGYCFSYRLGLCLYCPLSSGGLKNDSKSVQSGCLLHNRVRHLYFGMKNALNTGDRKKAKRLHKAWCKKLGLWKEGWR